MKDKNRLKKVMKVSTPPALQYVLKWHAGKWFPFFALQPNQEFVYKLFI